MSGALKLYLGFTLIMLLATVSLGTIASFAFLYPEFYNKVLPFYQLRPMHVSAALFWIISGGTAGIMFFKKEVFRIDKEITIAERLFIFIWIATVISIFGFYAFRKFGGREYWEFPTFLGLPILAAWACLMTGYFSGWRKREPKPPLYVWMWTTGIIFFLITFLEQNLYHIPWFRQSFLREVTVQWKSNGAMVGAWNQMIYGTSLLIMVKLSGQEHIARSKKAFFFYFLGLSNLMFNWGHHIYNLPTASWIRHVSYAISMTEWLIFISIIRDFKRKTTEQRKHRQALAYRFLIASEYWVFLNLALALFMSIPAVNRYTHGTHITVAHAMGATIGINTMILLSTIGYILKIDSLPSFNKGYIRKGFIITHTGLLIFWISLIAAGVLKGYRDVVLNMSNFQEMMQPVLSVLHLFAFSGILLSCGIAIVVWHYFVALKRLDHEKMLHPYPAFGLHSVKKEMEVKRYKKTILP